MIYDFEVYMCPEEESWVAYLDQEGDILEGDFKEDLESALMCYASKGDVVNYTVFKYEPAVIYSIKKSG